jgi:hypothetical protein
MSIPDQIKSQRRWERKAPVPVIAGAAPTRAARGQGAIPAADARVPNARKKTAPEGAVVVITSGA